jgi:hypothetical protein
LDALLSKLTQLILQTTANLGMCQFLKEFQFSSTLVALGEDDRSQPLALDFTGVVSIGRKDASTPAIARGFFDVRQPEHVMARTVGIKDDGAELLKLPRDQAFSGRHATKEA